MEMEERGWRVKILEKEKEIQEVGEGMKIEKNEMSNMERIGVEESI